MFSGYLTEKQESVRSNTGRGLRKAASGWRSLEATGVHSITVLLSTPARRAPACLWRSCAPGDKIGLGSGTLRYECMAADRNRGQTVTVSWSCMASMQPCTETTMHLQHMPGARNRVTRMRENGRLPSGEAPGRNPDPGSPVDAALPSCCAVCQHPLSQPPALIVFLQQPAPTIAHPIDDSPFISIYYP